jgi:hypothetical protein
LGHVRATRAGAAGAVDRLARPVLALGQEVRTHAQREAAVTLAEVFGEGADER